MIMERKNTEDPFLIKKYIKTIIFFLAVYTYIFFFDDQRDQSM